MKNSISVRVAAQYWDFCKRSSNLGTLIDESVERHTADSEMVKTILAKFEGAPTDPSEPANSYKADAALVRGLHDKLERLIPTSSPEQSVQLEVSKEEMRVAAAAMAFRADMLGEYPSMMREMALIYLVALFDAFLSDCIGIVLADKPEMLRSSKQITYERLLDFSDWSSLVASLVEREQTEFSHKSISDRLDFYRRKLNIELLSTEITIDLLSEMYARRNLLVHNRGIVNSTYLDVVESSALKLGDRVEIDSSYLKTAVDLAERMTTKLFRSLTEKFPVEKDELHLLSAKAWIYARRPEDDV